jgi:hypothetical protein
MSISLAFDFAMELQRRSAIREAKAASSLLFQSTCATHWPSGSDFFDCYGTKGGFER